MDRGVLALILAGGGGTRLWPLATPSRPKPSLPWGGGGRSLLRAALERPCPTLPPDHVRVLGSSVTLAALGADLADRDPGHLWTEPSPRNTGPALLLAAHRVVREEGDAVMVVLPADHRVEDEGSFRRALAAAIEEADAGGLVTMGVVPDRPATGYGYLEPGRGAARTAGARPIRRFVEKPDAATARSYLEDGRYLWNAGVFAWRAEVFLEAYRRVAPEVAVAAERAARSLSEGGRDAEAAWEAVPAGSVDYQLMEQAGGVSTVSLDAGWDDLGDWDAVLRLVEAGRLPEVAASRLPTESAGSVLLDFTVGGGRIAVVECPGCAVIRGPEGLLVLGRGRAGSVASVTSPPVEDGGR